MKRLFLLMLIASGPAHALTGNEWLRYCDDGTESGNFVCMVAASETAAGLQAGYIFRSLRLGTPPDQVERIYCLPEGVNKGQIRDVLYKYVGEHPERRHMAITRLGIDAWRTAFPCN